MTESAAGAPKAELNYITQTFFIQAMINAGRIPNPLSKKQETNRELAKFHIELLEILAQKTRGNLTPEEEQTLNNCLHQTRMAFIELGR